MACQRGDRRKDRCKREDQTSDLREGVYIKYCPTYEELIDICTSIDEELIYAYSSSRLDYFKSSVDWDNKLLLKTKQLKGNLNNLVRGTYDDDRQRKRLAEDDSEGSIEKRQKEH